MESMSEQQADHEVEQGELSDAVEMLGKGYERAAVEIHPPSTVMERRGREFREVEHPAFVKISTAFKAEMKDVDEISLKVWLYISLCVNRYSGRANPGLRTIARDTSFAVNTVRAAIERLENEYNLLTVDREKQKYNIYEPLAFVSANRLDPVSPDDTPAETVSVGAQTVSAKAETVSPRMILNQRNQKNQTSAQFQKITKAANKTVDAILDNERKTTGKQWTNLPEIYHPFAKAFQDATGIIYTKKQSFDWMDTFDEWLKSDFQPSDVDTAIRSIQADGRVSISRPGSVTWKLRAGVAAKHSQQVSFEDDPRGVW
jgi:hypothetical protein